MFQLFSSSVVVSQIFNGSHTTLFRERHATPSKNHLSQLASKRTLFVDLPCDGKKSKERPFGCLSLGIHAIIQTNFFFFRMKILPYLLITCNRF